YEEKVTAMSCLPENLEGKEYYKPTTQGLESKYGPRLEAIKKWKKDHKK
ncbi:MAG: replication-associated recombination protein A, partial [Bacilli bacterium]|nr:replication-associated recombination protein A [Bacilli bacterium]